MNSDERIIAALELRKPDRVPVLSQIGDHAGIIAGLTYDAMYSDPYKAAEAHLRALDKYKYDVVTIQVEPSWPIAEACGAIVTYPPNKNPWITDYVVKYRRDLENLSVPDFNACKSSWVMIEGTRILAQRANVPVAAYTPGPWTLSLQLMPYTTLISLTIKDRNFVQYLITKATEIILAYGKMLKEAGASLFVICEHDAQMISPRDFKELSINHLPPILDIFNHNILHVCGEVSEHLHGNAQSLKELEKLNMISIGPEVNLAEIKTWFNGAIGVAGNIDHLNLLPLGKPEDVEEACRIAIEQGKPGGGYILAAGCEITSDTPSLNVETMVEAATRYGTY